MLFRWRSCSSGDSSPAPQSIQERHACFFDPRTLVIGPHHSFAVRLTSVLHHQHRRQGKWWQSSGSAVQAFSAASSNDMATNSTVGSQQDVSITSRASGSCAGASMVVQQSTPPSSPPDIALRVTPNLQEFVLRFALKVEMLQISHARTAWSVLLGHHRYVCSCHMSAATHRKSAAGNDCRQDELACHGTSFRYRPPRLVVKVSFVTGRASSLVDLWKPTGLGTSRRPGHPRNITTFSCIGEHAHLLTEQSVAPPPRCPETRPDGGLAIHGVTSILLPRYPQLLQLCKTWQTNCVRGANRPLQAASKFGARPVKTAWVRGLQGMNPHRMRVGASPERTAWSIESVVPAGP